MGITFYEITHKPKGSSTTTELFDCRSAIIRLAIESKANSIELVFSNRFAKNATKFNEGDTVSVYANNTGVVQGTDLLISGEVKKYTSSTDNRDRRIQLFCMDKTYLLLNKIYMPGKVDDSEGLNVSEVIVKIISWVSESENRTPNITTTNVQTTPTGGTAFDDIGIALNMKTAYEWLQILSNDPYTRYDSGTISDRSYIFWVDSNNDLHWIYPSQTVDFTLIQGQNNILSISLEKSVFDVVNMVIFNAGTDNAGNGIWWYKYDDRTTTPEIRIKVQPMTDIARDILKREKDFMDANSLTYDASGYPDVYADYRTAGGPTWTYNYASAGKPTTDGEYLGTIGTEPTDNTGLRGAAVMTAMSRSLDLIRGTADLRWNGTIVVKGTKSYTPGMMISLTSPDYGLSSQKLRIHEVVHNIDKNCWITTLTVKQDEEALTT